MEMDYALQSSLPEKWVSFQVSTAVSSLSLSLSLSLVHARMQLALWICYLGTVAPTWLLIPHDYDKLQADDVVWSLNVDGLDRPTKIEGMR
jgi:hypothetical protein